MKKVIVFNLYGQSNIGDLAIRSEGLRIIDDIFKEAQIFLLAESKKDFPLSIKLKSSLDKEYGPYGYAIRSSNGPVSYIRKIYRFSEILILSSFFTTLGLISKNFLPKKGFYRFINLIAESDVAFSMGGGYFISHHAVKDFFGVLLNILPIIIAKIYNKKIIILPSSFGPFSAKIHESVSGYGIKNTLFFAREMISLNLVSKYNKKIFYSPDLALYSWNKIHSVAKQNYYVITFRETPGLNKNKQIEKELIIYSLIKYLWKAYKLKCIFIPMASNLIEESDLPVAQRLNNLINNSNIFKIIYIKTPIEFNNIVSHARIAICNRLHSAILSATAYVPFITLAYAHKTNGFMKIMDLEEWNLNLNDLTTDTLIDKANKLLINENYDRFKLKLKEGYVGIKIYKKLLVKEIKSFIY